MFRPLFSLVLLACLVRAAIGAEPSVENASSNDNAQAAQPVPKRASIHLEEVKEFRPPIRLLDANSFGDGGTVYVHLKDSQGKEIVCCVSQTMGSAAPDGTLFLNAYDPSRASARLPFSVEEAKLVERSIAAAVADAFDLKLNELSHFDPYRVQTDKKELHDDGQRDKKLWRARHAFGALRLLENVDSHAYMDAHRKHIPEWYAAYDEDRQEGLAEQRRLQQSRDLFASFYPESARGLLLLEGGFDSGAAADPSILQAQKLTKAIEDPAKLFVMTCKAFGSTSEWTGSSNPMEQVAATAVANVDGDDILKAFDMIKEDRRALQGAAFLFFFKGLGRKIPAPERAEWAARLAEVILTDGAGEDKSTVLNYLAAAESQETLDLLRSVANGSVGTEIVHSHTLDDECVLKLRPHALLCLAVRGNASVKPQIEQLLEVTDGCDKMALEVSLALLGEPNYLKREHFQVVSHEIPIGALRAVSKCNGRYGLDFAIEEALDHNWAAVRVSAINTVKQVTGRRSFHEGKWPQRYTDERLIQRWWRNEGEDWMKKQSDESE